MAQRSRRKRRRPGAGATAGVDTAPAAAPADDVAGEPTTEAGYYARQRARDEAARARLEPLAPGERPRALRIAAGLAALLAVANVALLAAGWEVQGRRQQVAGTLLFSAVMGAIAWFIWQKRHWAVLGFQALLGITMLFAFLALLTASNAQAVLLCLVIIGLAAPLFWTLVKVMARLQVPQRPGRATGE